MPKNLSHKLFTNYLTECLCCSVYFSVASFNITGKTLLSLLEFTIRVENKRDLKDPWVIELQMRLKDVKYIIRDEFLVLGQKILNWVDRQCRQASTNMEIPFGGISVILLGDIVQLPPVMDKALYHKRPTNEFDTAGFSAYTLFQMVVKLSLNEKTKRESQSRNSNTLTNLQNAVPTRSGWDLFSSEICSNIGRIERKSQYVKLTFPNESVAANNYEAPQRLNVPFVQIHAWYNSKTTSVCGLRKWVA